MLYNWRKRNLIVSIHEKTQYCDSTMELHQPVKVALIS